MRLKSSRFCYYSTATWPCSLVTELCGNASAVSCWASKHERSADARERRRERAKAKAVKQVVENRIDVRVSLEWRICMQNTYTGSSLPLSWYLIPLALFLALERRANVAGVRDSSNISSNNNNNSNHFIFTVCSAFVASFVFLLLLPFFSPYLRECWCCRCVLLLLPLCMCMCCCCQPNEQQSVKDGRLGSV